MNNKIFGKPLILAVSTSGLDADTSSTGFHAMDENNIMKVLHGAGLWLGQRPTLEAMPAFRQIIPYIVLRYQGKFIRYTRTEAGGENRLHGRQSIGLGGHTDLADIVQHNSIIDISATLNETAKREVDEELGEVKVLSKKWVGLLSDTSNEVGKVHIGVVGVWELQELPDGESEDAIGAVEICGATDINANFSRLETWSSILFGAYFNN